MIPLGQLFIIFDIPISESKVATEELDLPGEKSQFTGDVEWQGQVAMALG